MSILDTLQENDFFNVIFTGEKIKYAKECLTKLVQATKENKEMFKDAIQRMDDPQGQIKLDNAIEEAFKILYKGMQLP